VLEALASGVPAIVTPDGGPKYIVREFVSGEPETGVIAEDSGFAAAIAAILCDPKRLAAMRTNARAYALTCSWDAVFDGVYDGYRDAFEGVREERFAGAGDDSSPA
jgi:glycosyltransferase involved in cell wall biosynthesis